MDKEYLVSLIEKLRSYSDETEWVEFKVNNYTPDMIGEYISAISNSAALHEKEWGYLVWGVHDKTHEIIGTEFNYRKTKIGNEELENWLSIHLKPRLDFRFYDVEIGDNNLVIMFVPAATNSPVAFKSEEYIRVGSYKKKLKETYESLTTPPDYNEDYVIPSSYNVKDYCKLLVKSDAAVILFTCSYNTLTLKDIIITQKPEKNNSI